MSDTLREDVLRALNAHVPALFDEHAGPIAEARAARRGFTLVYKRPLEYDGGVCFITLVVGTGTFARRAFTHLESPE
jgi:hypothetical protein